MLINSIIFGDAHSIAAILEALTTLTSKSLLEIHIQNTFQLKFQTGNSDIQNFSLQMEHIIRCNFDWK